MLADALKEEIQAAYSRFLEHKGFKARHCQKAMIAEIARILGALDPDAGECPPNTCVVEAGTGTGKTIAYALAAIPVAKALKKKIVISTATVALQEQIIYQDLPDIRQHSGLEFSFALAKGRRRYICLSRLDLALQDASMMNRTLALYDTEPGQGEVDSSATEVFAAMLKQLGSGDWDGDRDNWPVEVDHNAWMRVSADRAQCTGRRCSHYGNCRFFKARESVNGVECIVANHDLVLADLMMGGSAVLPPPEECIYIFDEGHHLPDKAASHLSHFMGLYATRSWLQQAPTSLKQAASELMIADVSPRAEQLAEDLLMRFDDAAQLFQQFQAAADEEENGWRYRFPLGVVPPEAMSLSGDMASAAGRLLALVEQFEAGVSDLVEDASGGEREVVERWLSAVSGMASRLQACLGLCQSFASADDATPCARWVSFREGGNAEGMDIHLSSCPISVAGQLAEVLWQRSFGVVVTSATLSVGGDFSSFRERSGIDPENRFVALPSPFDFPGKAVLRIPRMQTEPTQAGEHTGEITRMIPALLGEARGSLVLFTSWRQMLSVMDNIDPAFRERVLCQGKLSKIEMVSRHKAAVDSNTKSCIFGLASFAEGIDLPGDYCTHVVIAKIPFAVPNDPVAATLSEWIESNGGNAFREITVPDAAIRMVQMSGRLLRTETDEGQVTVLDRRLLTKFYGKRILGALPAFRREFE